MLTPEKFYDKVHGDDNFLAKPSIIKLMDEYHQEKMKEVQPIMQFNQNYETKRNQSVNLGVSKESKKDIY